MSDFRYSYDNLDEPEPLSNRPELIWGVVISCMVCYFFLGRCARTLRAVCLYLPTYLYLPIRLLVVKSKKSILILLQFQMVSWICVCLRLYVRFRIVRAPGWDDLCVGLYLVSGTRSALVGTSMDFS